MSTVISVENLSKSYQLGQIGTGTFAHDLNVWWARMRGKPNPMLRIGEADQGHRDGEELWALKDVSFTVQQGEVLGIIGRNGAGKSTLLKILSRVTAPTSGVVKVKGRIASLLEVGTGFHPELTGRENVYLNGAILGMSRREIDRKFDEIVDFAEVEKFIDTPVKRYSSGMYVRLAFAVAAHLEPEILVVDEVLAVGDAEFQKKCLGKMGDVAHEGRTVLFVSHNMVAVSALCAQAVLLRLGAIDLIGKTEEVIIKHLNRNLHTDGLFANVNRTGSGDVRFTQWNIHDDVLGDGYRVFGNSPCRFILHYQTHSDRSSLHFAIVIKDNLGQRVLTASTEFYRQNFIIKSLGYLECKFETLPLTPGIYSLHLWCGVGGQTVDLVENAGEFEVVARDVYQSGWLPQKKHGQIVIPHEWKIYDLG